MASSQKRGKDTDRLCFQNVKWCFVIYVLFTSEEPIRIQIQRFLWTLNRPPVNRSVFPIDAGQSAVARHCTSMRANNFINLFHFRRPNIRFSFELILTAVPSIWYEAAVFSGVTDAAFAMAVVSASHLSFCENESCPVQSSLLLPFPVCFVGRFIFFSSTFLFAPCVPQTSPT